mmetsp:Transcript_45282/g.79882  ORF Transcript_45282/g.79882 Transcript_45282/m.79882 type:complete len:113 (-) Transcript_45282:613-951(-)
MMACGQPSNARDANPKTCSHAPSLLKPVQCHKARRLRLCVRQKLRGYPTGTQLSQQLPRHQLFLPLTWTLRFPLLSPAPPPPPRHILLSAHRCVSDQQQSLSSALAVGIEAA